MPKGDRRSLPSRMPVRSPLGRALRSSGLYTQQTGERVAAPRVVVGRRHPFACPVLPQRLGACAGTAYVVPGREHSRMRVLTRFDPSSTIVPLTLSRPWLDGDATAEPRWGAAGRRETSLRLAAEQSTPHERLDHGVHPFSKHRCVAGVERTTRVATSCARPTADERSPVGVRPRARSGSVRSPRPPSLWLRRGVHPLSA